MIEFFFDISSPWTYLAFESVQPLAKELGTDIEWRPILVGGVFNAVNPSVYQSREHPVPAKRDYMLKDLQDWARHGGISIQFPPTVFPVNSVKAMRCCVALADTAHLVPFARTAFHAYWGLDKDISQDEVLAAILRENNLPLEELFAAISTATVKNQLKANTDELIARGGFGSPTVFVNRTDMYFGNDRMPLIKAAVARLAGSGKPGSDKRAERT